MSRDSTYTSSDATATVSSEPWLNPDGIINLTTASGSTYKSGSISETFSSSETIDYITVDLVKDNKYNFTSTVTGFISYLVIHDNSGYKQSVTYENKKNSDGTPIDYIYDFSYFKNFVPDYTGTYYIGIKSAYSGSDYRSGGDDYYTITVNETYQASTSTTPTTTTPTTTTTTTTPSIDASSSGTSGDDTYIGTSNNDTYYGFAGNDTFSGNNGNDYFDGGDGDDTISGNLGNDTIHGKEGNDFLSGGKDEDYVYGGEGNDNIFGNMALDRIYGEGGDDTIKGGWGNDIINGGDGNDLIYGADEADIMTGGSGSDTFCWSMSVHSTAQSMDSITDFTTNADVIDLSVIRGVESNAQASIQSLVNDKTTINDALNVCAANNTLDGGICIFKFGVDAYVYRESSGSGVTAATDDLVVKLSGTGTNISFSDIKTG